MKIDSKDVSQSEAIGCAITEAWHRECADRAGISYEEFMESVNKGEF